jgi:hypothetical protein
MDRILELSAERPLVYLPSHDLDAGRRLVEREVLAKARV